MLLFPESGSLPEKCECVVSRWKGLEGASDPISRALLVVMATSPRATLRSNFLADSVDFSCVERASVAGVGVGSGDATTNLDTLQASRLP